MINKVRSILMTLVLLSFFLPSFAQSPEELEQRMDEIRMDEAYIYGDDYNDNMDMAYQNALTGLLASVNELRADKGLEFITASSLQPVVKEMKYTKGTRCVVFLYLSLTQAMSLATGPKANVVALPESKPVDNKNNASVPQKREEQSRLSSVTTVLTSQAVSAVSPAADNGILDVLCAQDNWVEIKGLLISFKKEGRIKETGNCRSYTEVPDDAYAILMDSMGGILSIMSPKNSPERINHKTNLKDNENNHTNCKFIVWYK